MNVKNLFFKEILKLINPKADQIQNRLVETERVVFLVQRKTTPVIKIIP